MSETAPTPALSPETLSTAVVTPATTQPGFWLRLSTLAAGAYYSITKADSTVESVLTSHPEVMAAATVLEGLAPPELKAGINIALEVAKVVNSLLAQAATVGSAAA